ncbi:glycoside hydrolase family 18 protein [Planctomycetota bacterium]
MVKNNNRRVWIMAVVLIAMLAGCKPSTACSQQADPGKDFDVCDSRVVGWYWWQMKDEFPVSAVRFEDLTHIVYNPEKELHVTPDGHIKETGAIDDNLVELTAKAHNKGVKVLMMMSEPGEDFNVMMSKPSRRTSFIREVVDYLLEHGLDGVEYDWEGNSHKDPYDWLGQEGQIDRANYTTIIKETKAALREHNLIVTICGAAWPPCFVTAEAFEHIEFISIMSYRDFEHAVRGLKVWTDIGAPRSLLNMGMAVGFNEHGRDQQLAAKEVRYVMENGYGGLLLFQLNYDTKDDNSMLKTVGETMRELKSKHGCKQ